MFSVISHDIWEGASGKLARLDLVYFGGSLLLREASVSCSFRDPEEARSVLQTSSKIRYLLLVGRGERELGALRLSDGPILGTRRCRGGVP
jgi:hypothetical protein